ncbi:MAG TPA: hypothetical protein DCQ64_13745 [Candidatus Rokubacteria bacterium]|nr:MAG: hypothetical protein A2X53_12395 [Candidatus Rokubacteria bacterium GWA2_70_23]OGK89441.1 MAG: hypothetical protein A2X50_09945 [Candidatus Rokubacteria bacterium GWF2_70_14]HAM56393.1 hypothetical protein [Candidatus Rokubacteria bacterium]
MSFGAAVPYLPLLDIVRQLLGIGEAAGPESMTAKARASAEALGLEPGAVAFLLHLLGVDEETFPRGLSAEAVRMRTYATLGQLCERAGRRQPLVLVVEDLQWIDRTSEVTRMSGKRIGACK